MATSKEVETGWYNVGYRLRMLIERIAVDVAGNRSEIRSRVWVESSGGNNGRSYYWGPVSSAHGHSINGEQVYTGDISRTLKAGGSTQILNNTRWVTHNSDGTYSVDSAATFSNSWTGDMYISGTLVLDTIPRTSTISTTGSFTTGSAKDLAWSPGSSTFRHDLHYRIGTGSWVSIASNQTDSYSWTPAHAIFQGDNATSKTITVRLTTKTGSGGSTIGSTTKNFTLNLNSNQIPGVPSVAFAEQNTSVASKFPGLVLQSKSLLKGTVSASTVLGASITSKTIRVGGTNYTEADSIRFTTSGTVPVTVTVVDSRGRSRASTVNVAVTQYRDPQLTRFLARRCDSDGELDPSGEYIRIDMTASASSVKPSSTELNKLKIVTKTRPVGGATSTRHTRTDTGIAFNNWYVIPEGANYPVSQTFEIILEVTDEAHDGPVPQNIARVETDAVVMHWDNVGVGVGKYREQGALDVGPGGIYSDGLRLAGFRAPVRDGSALPSTYPDGTSNFTANGTDWPNTWGTVLTIKGSDNRGIQLNFPQGGGAAQMRHMVNTSGANSWGAWQSLQVVDDTGWVSINTPSGWTTDRAIEVRSLNGIVHWRGRITPTSDKDGTTAVLPAGTVPTWARPVSIYDSMRTVPSNHSAGSREASVKNAGVGNDGSVTVWYGTANTDPINLAGLSGYIAE